MALVPLSEKLIKFLFFMFNDCVKVKTGDNESHELESITIRNSDILSM